MKMRQTLNNNNELNMAQSSTEKYSCIDVQMFIFKKYYNYTQVLKTRLIALVSQPFKWKILTCWLKTSSILFTTNFFLDAFHLSKNNEDGSCQLRMVGPSSQFKTCVSWDK
jgi:hypothetical protein